MRNVWDPLAANVNVVGCVSQYAPFCQPHFCTLVAPASVARLMFRPDDEFSGNTAAPFACASENCTHTESFNLELASACIRTHSRYGVAANASNGTSM